MPDVSRPALKSQISRKKGGHLAPFSVNAALIYCRARYIFIWASLSSIASPDTSTKTFFTVPE